VIQIKPRNKRNWRKENAEVTKVKTTERLEKGNNSGNIYAH